jgi:hypothetical protein
MRRLPPPRQHAVQCRSGGGDILPSVANGVLKPEACLNKTSESHNRPASGHPNEYLFGSTTA